MADKQETYLDWLRTCDGHAFFKFFGETNNIEDYLPLVRKGANGVLADCARAHILKGIINYFRPSKTMNARPKMGHYWVQRSDEELMNDWLWVTYSVIVRKEQNETENAGGYGIIVRKWQKQPPTFGFGRTPDGESFSVFSVNDPAPQVNTIVSVAARVVTEIALDPNLLEF